MAEESIVSFTQKKFKLLTWNIWFDIRDREERMAALIEYILKEQPDVVCLQEVVPKVKIFLSECSSGMAQSILDGSNKVEIGQKQSNKASKFGRGLLDGFKNLSRPSSHRSESNDQNTDINKLTKATKLTDHYVFSDNEIKIYGLLTLVKKQGRGRDGNSVDITNAKFDYQDFSESSMDRGLLQAILNVEINIEAESESLNKSESTKKIHVADKHKKKRRNFELVVATSHLESKNNQNTRKLQIKETVECLKDYPMAVFCGDFNFDSTKSYGDWVKRPPMELENIVLQKEMPDYIDSWAFLKHRNDESEGYCWNVLENDVDPGYTIDGVSNSKYIKHVNKRMRYDRVMAKGLIPKSIEVVGKEVICLFTGSKDTRKIKISDHYGLLTEFELQ